MPPLAVPVINMSAFGILFQNQRRLVISRRTELLKIVTVSAFILIIFNNKVPFFHYTEKHIGLVAFCHVLFFDVEAGSAPAQND